MKKVRVLVVDDDRLNLQMMHDMLTPLGYEVLTAENGSTCLDAARSELPDLIFLDVVMPVMDGFEACEMLKADSQKHR